MDATNTNVALGILVRDFADALVSIDAERPRWGDYQEGIGPFTEDATVDLVTSWLKVRRPDLYGQASTRTPYPNPGTRQKCDLVIPGQWAIEVKPIRPYGNNDRVSEDWIKNILYPYSGNTSALGDCIKLKESGFNFQKAILIYGFEHTPPKVDLLTAVNAFELIAAQVLNIALGPRHFADFGNLVHPVHQQGKVFAWEVM